MSTIEITLASILRLSNITILTHLLIKNDAAHRYLDDFYHNSIKLFDEIVETHQGDMKELMQLEVGTSTGFVEISDYINLLDSMKVYYRENKILFSPEIQSLFDELLLHINKTIYKLKYLC